MFSTEVQGTYIQILNNIKKNLSTNFRRAHIPALPIEIEVDNKNDQEILEVYEKEERREILCRQH